MKQHLKKLTLTLVALFAISTGAWADNPKVKYALTSDLTISSGTTVEVKDGTDVVATITYSETGGSDFTTKATTNISALDGYTAYTEGNGKNGNNTGGTFYTIVPAYDGTIDVAVILSADKPFYILEDGTALADYNGITKSDKYYGTFSFAVSKDKAYKLYCSGGKLGFYGFEYTFGAAPAGTALTPDATRKVWTLDKMPAGDVELQVEYYPGMLTLAQAEHGSIEVDGLSAATLPAGFETDGTNYYVADKTEFQVKAVPAEGFHLASLMFGETDITDQVDADGIATVTMPEGENDITLTATFSDEYDITFNAANANTIEAGKATVKVGDAAATVTEGKLQGVKYGQKVTMTAATGYKFTDVKSIVANNWVNYGYTGSNTFFGTSNSSSRFTWTLMYTPSMLTGNYLKTVQTASYNTNPVTLKVYSGGDTPESGELIATQVYESPQANYYYDIELEQPVKFDQTKNLWIELSQVSKYAAYCGRQPTDSNGKIWYRVDDGTWNSNESYTPEIYIQVLSTIPATLSNDGKTASFDMPASDITMDYTLKRDMTVSMTTQVGDGTDGYRIRLKKNEQGEGYVPAEMTPQEMASLITVTDNIEQQDLTNVTDYTVQIFAVDEQGQITGDAINFASLVPSSYVAVATAADGSTYDGSTDMSNVFQLFEGYEVEVPAGEFVTYYKDEALTVEDDEAQLYTITAVSETTATATPFDVIPANVPLLLKNNSSETRTILLIPTEDPLAFMHYSGFVGSLDPTTIAASTDTQTNYACNGKAFVYVKDAISAGANKAWLEIPASANGARQLKIVFADATGISAVSGLPADNGDWFDLNGRKLQAAPTKKGVYIKDGKKVVIK